MGRLRSWIRRLEKASQGDGFIVRLSDGTSTVFAEMEVQKQMFLARMDLFRKDRVHYPVLEAVREVTPESRARFEERYGSITFSNHIISAEGWVEAYTLHEDGTVERTFHEAGSEEAEHVREEARRPPQAWQK